MNTSPHAAAFKRMQQLMSTSPVPSISTVLLVTAAMAQQLVPAKG